MRIRGLRLVRWLQAFLFVVAAHLSMSTLPVLAEERATEEPALEAGSSPEPAEDAAELPRELRLTEFLVIPPPSKYPREPLHVDPIDAVIALGAWETPTTAKTVTDQSGRIHRWERATVGEDGWLRDATLAGGGYAFAQLDSPRERMMILEARGHAMVYVNGHPRAGDPYQNGGLRLPVHLRAGKNEFLFHLAGGALDARLVEPEKSVALDTSDTTLPDVLAGHSEPLWGAVLLINASDQPHSNLSALVTREGAEPVRTPLGPIARQSTRKIGFQLPGGSAEGAQEVRFTLQIVAKAEEKVLDELELTLPVRQPTELHRRTFVSRIDGSVQYYAVRPAAPASELAPRGLILTLHGAGVEATAQADGYTAKPWADVVAPTNRRPFGFAWEDWGRIDALEVLDDARKNLHSDPRRTYLTGHSMGGHGTWHLGATYPDRFAAIGPSAGWCSFWTYGRIPKLDTSTELNELLARGTTPSDPLRLLRNLSQPAVYILHGQEDDNVPVAQARLMRSQLALFHSNFAYYEHPGGGHWWGNDSCDWPPLIDFFRHQTLPKQEDVNQVDFLTANPAISSQCHWLEIESQQKQLTPSRATITLDREKRTFVGQTENVTRLSLDVSMLEPNQPLSVTLDGVTIETIAWPTDTRRLWLGKRDDQWVLATRPARRNKGPHRYGTFKAAFDNRVIFVYGTQGTPEENAWAEAKARFDAETFYYRGNASIDVVPDTEFDPNADTNRNVILYGNAETHGNWSTLLGNSPIQVQRDVVRIGTRPETGSDLACLFVRPRPKSETALVGVVSGTGLAGMRATDRVRYFISGIAYPDLLLFSADSLTQGAKEIRAVGYFANDWGINDAELEWRDLAL